jgi:hypothetical protein
MMIVLSIKILLLLWAINLAPPLMTHWFKDTANRPLDGGNLFRDGKPLLGPHKTVRGFAGGVFTGAVFGWLMGFPVTIGLMAGFCSMFGDLISSFIKRRCRQPSGAQIPGLDQGFEGGLPIAMLAWYYHIAATHALMLWGIFGMGAFMGSLFLNSVLLSPPFEGYSRPIRLLPRIREWRACQSIRHPLHFLFNIDRTLTYRVFMRTIFKMLGLYEQGKQNALDIRRKHITFYFEDLPDLFDDYAILFLSDLHLDGLSGMTTRLQRQVRGLDVDLCLLGGDYRGEQHGSFAGTLLHLHHLIRTIHAADGIFGVMGNHDCLEMVPLMEKRGLSFLINDAVCIERGSERLWIAGVDDPYYFASHDLEETFRNIPQDAFTILVSHTPEIYREAAGYAPQLFLCGHTHAGQIQLPWIGPLFTCCRAPRSYSNGGKWHYGGMQGYTSAGAGVSGIPVRFGCRGEIVHITLKKGVPPGHED